MKIRFLIILLLGILYFSPVASAAGVGFVPTSRLWFSNLSTVPADGTKIFTVIVNNDYPFLDATVGFYINDKLTDTVDINHLAKEQAAQVSGIWHPTQGEYKISVQFVKAVAIDENGQKTFLDVSTFNNVTDSDVKIPSNGLGDSTTSSLLLSASLVPVLDLKVEKNGDNLTITKVPNPIQDFEKRIEVAAQQQQDIKDKISNTVGMISSTAADISDVRTRAKSFFNQVKDFFAGDNFLFHIASIKMAAADFMDTVTNHYEPKRSAIAFGVFLGGLILLYTFFWFLKRRKDY